jgi:hypothetical protein
VHFGVFDDFGGFWRFFLGHLVLLEFILLCMFIGTLLLGVNADSTHE